MSLSRNGGVPSSAPTGAKADWRRANAIAAAANLVSPFSPSWGPVSSDSWGPAREAAAHETAAYLLRAGNPDESFLAPGPRISALISNRMALRMRMVRFLADDGDMAVLDILLKSGREKWSRLIAAAARAVDDAKPSDRMNMLERVAEHILVNQLLGLGAAAGAKPLQLLGTYPRTEEGQFFRLLLGDRLVAMANRVRLQPRVDTVTRARNWAEFANSEAPVRLRCRAWLRGLSAALEAADRQLARDIDQRVGEQLRRELTSTERSWHEDIVRWSHGSTMVPHRLDR